MRGVFLELVPHERIVFSFGWEPTDEHRVGWAHFLPLLIDAARAGAAAGGRAIGAVTMRQPMNGATS